LATIFQTKNYTSPVLDDLLMQAEKTLDPTKRLKNLEDASKLVIDDVAEIPIYSRTDNTAYDPTLVIHRDSYIGTYFWQVYRKG
jgi:ABC-type transport system substrate-binding protein